ncbi:MAG: J domain-containing protein [Microscillaceae bacterium]|nr:J domain-containing protein [Microscillaceae bacterium]
MALSDRFLQFLKIELNDFLGKYDDNHSQSLDSGWWQKMQDLFTPEPEAAPQNAQSQWKHRQERRSQFRNTGGQHQQGESHGGFQKSHNSPEKKYYEALEVAFGADFEQIKAAYKQAMKKYHPDRFASDPQKQEYAKQLCQKINEAYEYFQKSTGKADFFEFFPQTFA